MASNKSDRTMRKIDKWLDTPTDFYGENYTCFPNVIHIDTTSESDAYIENKEDGILYFDEMDEQMISQVEAFIENLS